MKSLFAVLVVAALVVLGVVGFAYSGFYDVSAKSAHSGLVNWLLSTTSHASIERSAKAVVVPDLSDDAFVRAGINDFDAMCAGCHGTPGQPPEAMGQGLNPPAPDLAESAAHMDPAELFWVTKHGIKMTGMPAWGVTHDDDSLWPVVAFMATLPELDTDSYRALLTSAEGMGHHAANDDEQTSHDHGDAEAAAKADDHDAETPTTSTDLATQDGGADDHSTHNHDTPASAKKEEPHDDENDHDH